MKLAGVPPQNWVDKLSDTGSGIINIIIEGDKNVINEKNLKDILTLKNIKQSDFDIEKKRLICEVKLVHTLSI